MQMAIAPDGGIVTQPYQWFDENRSVYRYIEARLDGTRRAYLNADLDDRLRLLFDSTTYGLLTANAPLYQADRAFEAYVDHYPNPDQASLRDDLRDAGIGYYNNRSEYIVDNFTALDDVFVPVDNLLSSGREDNAQSVLMDARGIGPAKSAFSLAMVGFTDHACLDTNVCQQLGIDPRSYEKHTADEYQLLVDEVFDELPQLRGEVSPFLLQWILFDCNRGTVETHDQWFDHVLSITGSESISATGNKVVM